MTEGVTPEAQPVLTAGQRLRRAREATGLHVVALAAMLKVPVRKLEALESDRLSELPDKTFVRALALSVCRQLKVDATEILALLPQTDQVRLGESPTLNTPFRSPDVTLAQKSAGVPLPKPALFAAAVLLLAAVVWFVVPEREPAAVRANPPANNPPAVAETVTPPPPLATPGPTETPPPGPAPEAAAANAPTVTTAPAEPGDVNPSAPDTATAATAAPAADSVLVIRVSDISWVEVIGAGGSVLLQRELLANESVGFSTGAPYKVVVGRADATQVRVRGKALDISGYARNNVARFEVK